MRAIDRGWLGPSDYQFYSASVLTPERLLGVRFEAADEASSSGPIMAGPTIPGTATNMAGPRRGRSMRMAPILPLTAARDQRPKQR